MDPPEVRQHRQLDAAGSEAAGLAVGTVRRSVGIEDAEDLVADLHRGPAAAGAAQEGVA